MKDSAECSIECPIFWKIRLKLKASGIAISYIFGFENSYGLEVQCNLGLVTLNSMTICD